MLQEAFDGLALGVGQVGEIVLDGLEVGYVGEEHLRVDPVFVDVVEVAEEDVAPENELVKRLRLGIQGPVAVVELDEELDPVRGADAGRFVEEVVDGQQLRGELGPAGTMEQDLFLEVLPEEGVGAAVRENEAAGAQRPCVRAAAVGGGLSKKWSHRNKKRGKKLFVLCEDTKFYLYL